MRQGPRCSQAIAVFLGFLSIGACNGEPFQVVAPAVEPPISQPNASDGPAPAPVVPKGCEGAPRANGELLRDECGVFVAPLGDDANDGASQRPVATFRRAIELARVSPKRIYVCEGRYEEGIVLEDEDKGLILSGRLRCSGTGDEKFRWSYAMDAKVVVAPPAPAVPLRVLHGKRQVVIEDVSFEASAAAKEGASSVGALLVESDVSFVRVHIEAHDGAPGPAALAPVGDAPAPTPIDASATPDGNAGEGAVGGASKVCRCGPDTTTGGRGGNRSEAGLAGQVNADSAPYSDSISPSSRDGQGGTGGTASNVQCSGGRIGSTPGASPSGAGARAGLWSVSALGVTALLGEGSSGRDGRPGQGGGGGGGYYVTLGNTGAGGSGGCGGCGGAGGLGGKPGGASIGLAMADARVTLDDDSSVSAGRGGRGGKGAQGQAGSAGANGAMGFGGCPGAQGGAGGQGGGGGGGSGGPSISVLYKGLGPLIGKAKLEFGSPGEGGEGGDPLGNAVTRGERGEATALLVSD